MAERFGKLGLKIKMLYFRLLSFTFNKAISLYIICVT